MPPHSSREHRLALVQIHFAVLLAGGTGLFGKLLNVSPAVITAGRTLVASVALALVAWTFGVSLRLRSFQDGLVLAISGGLLAVHWFTFFHSIQVSTVTIGLLAFSTFPMMVTLLEPLFFREKLHRHDMLTALVVTAGLGLVTPSFRVSDRLTQGLLWGLLSALACALFSLFSRSSSRAYPAVATGFYQQVMTAFCTLPFALDSSSSLTRKDLLLLLLLGLVFTALLQVLILASLKHMRAQVASVMFGLEPVYGVVFASLLLGESLSTRTMVGGTLICGAVLWASFTHGKRGAIAHDS